MEGQRGRERWRDGEGVKAVFFKQIRFEEIGLSGQESHDLHPSITGGEAGLQLGDVQECTFVQQKYTLNSRYKLHLRWNKQQLKGSRKSLADLTFLINEPL